MFRLISLNFQDDILGHFREGDLQFVPEVELGNTNSPYTSVIIGQNGTGKSTLLYYIAEIFRDLEYYRENQRRRRISKINFSYAIEYEIDDLRFKVIQRRDSLERKSGVPGWKYQFSIAGKDLPRDFSNWSDLRLPSNVVAVCYLPMDRFSKTPNSPDDYYLYLGLVDKSNAARPRFIMNNTVPLLFDLILKDKSVDNLIEILKFMEVDEDYLGIKTSYRYKKFFFSGNLTTREFVDLFGDWKQFSQREEKPFGVDYYEKNIANDTQTIARIVNYINERVTEDSIKAGEKSVLNFNILNTKEVINEWEILIHLKKLDLLEPFSLVFRKTKNYVDDFKLSSGEFHFFSTMIALIGGLKENSLVLIDEPETSFHPNWQMKYINHLKFLFKRYNSAHFILSTHSHFIVSDLEGKSSEVIGLTGQTPRVKATPLERNTYGWSAEEVLYKVFNLRSTRNYFFEISLRELLHKISNKSENKERIMKLVKELSNTELDNNDPLTQILEEANEYVQNM